MSQEKTWFSNYLLSKYKPDFMVVCETWDIKQINLYNKDYEVNQTEYTPHQGVWIITKLGYITKVWKNNEPYFITVQWGEADSIFIIGAYFKIEKQKIIMEQIKKMIKRINRTFNNANILFLWDLNPRGKFTSRYVAKELNLRISNMNEKLITRKQKHMNSNKESCLDFLFCSKEITTVQWIKNFKSDHIRLLFETKTNACIKNKKNIVKKSIKISNKAIKCLIKDKNWPDELNLKKQNRLFWKKIKIEPTIKVHENINQAIGKTTNWEEIDINIKTILNENFKEYIRDLNVTNFNGANTFYKIAKSILKPKMDKFVKGIKINDAIYLVEEKNKLVVKHFSNLFNDEESNIWISNNGIFDYRPDIDFAKNKIAKDKACGPDAVPGEIFKISEIENELKHKLRISFENYLRLWKIPDYFMKARLILLSKDGTNQPDIEKTRPIRILPVITKVFELWILNKLIKVTESAEFNKQQRGFIKGSSTSNNINDLLQFGRGMQIRRKLDKREQGAFAFFDLKNAYDTVTRELLIQKLQQFHIPCNIISTVTEMLWKFCLKYRDHDINTNEERTCARINTVTNPVQYFYKRSLEWVY